ncbi:MAG: GTPase [Planctomycetota bacterium]
MTPARWRVETPRQAAGAIALITVRSAGLDAVIDQLGIAPLAPGDRRPADLLGIDHAVVARPTPDRLLLMPHAGHAVLRALESRLAEALGPEDRAGPEALRDRLTDALARAHSPRAIDLLLDQPRRWSEAGLDPAGDPLGAAIETDRVAPPTLNRLITPPTIAAVGPPNVGKSTLLNALAGRQLAIARDEHGTTRDHVGAELVLDALAVRWLDAPGLMDRPDPTDCAAIELALEAVRSADLVCLCGDAAAAPPDPAELGIRAQTLRLALRTDLAEPGWAADLRLSAPPDGSRPRGLSELAELARRTLVPDADLDDPRPWAFWTADSDA